MSVMPADAAFNREIYLPASAQEVFDALPDLALPRGTELPPFNLVSSDEWSHTVSLNTQLHATSMLGERLSIQVIPHGEGSDLRISATQRGGGSRSFAARNCQRAVDLLVAEISYRLQHGAPVAPTPEELEARAREAAERAAKQNAKRSIFGFSKD
jgi:hypothetical protein